MTIENNGNNQALRGHYSCSGSRQYSSREVKSLTTLLTFNFPANN